MNQQFWISTNGESCLVYDVEMGGVEIHIPAEAPVLYDGFVLIEHQEFIKCPTLEFTEPDSKEKIPDILKETGWFYVGEI